jgi:hypothetical protein
MGLPFLDSGREKYITTRPRDSQKFKPKLNPGTCYRLGYFCIIINVDEKETTYRYM